MFGALGLTSCDKYLDKLPDNRMELKTPEEVSKLLVSAYATHNPAFLLEMYSDNTNEYDNTAWSGIRFQDQAYNWQDITEVSTYESPQSIWDAYYEAIRNANEAISYIRKQDDQSEYSSQLGEALLCRAYSEFVLSTVFCQAYDSKTADKTLGLPYPEQPSNTLIENYERGTMADFYKKIDADLQEGLPLVTNTYDHPKFHFTKNAAYAFAARFYLFYEKFDKAIEYADIVLGNDPTSKVRDWAAWNKLSANDQIQPNAYVNSDNSCNLLLQVVYSYWGAYGGPYLIGNKYAHGRRLSQYETLQAQGPWGATATATGYTVFYNDALSKYILRKVPVMLEYTDVSAGTGYPHSEYVVFSTDETLLVRAEAYALKGELNKSLEDVNAEMSAFMPHASALTLSGIESFYTSLDYYTPEYPTPRYELHPNALTISGDTQESLIDCILQLRRLVTIHEGFRLQDVKRYGITMYRIRLDESNQVEAVTDQMNANDPRLAIQVPQDVIDAGLEANPRNK